MINEKVNLVTNRPYSDKNLITNLRKDNDFTK